MSSAAEFERLYVRPKPGRALIVGSRIHAGKPDRRKLYGSAVGVDLEVGEGVDVVANLETDYLGEFAHIECMSVLEHCRRPWALADNLQDMLEEAGTIYVTAPFVWRVHRYPDDYWRFTTSGIRELFPAVEWVAEAYSHRVLTNADDVPWAKSDDWPHCARTEVCMFGHKA